jgi:hypothetical protein
MDRYVRRKGNLEDGYEKPRFAAATRMPGARCLKSRNPPLSWRPAAAPG